MARNHGNLMAIMLEALGESSGFFRWPPEGSYEWIRREIRSGKKQYHAYYNTVSYIKKKGLAQSFSRNGQKFLKLTSKGQLELLLQKSTLARQKIWDKKWRLFIFDIPEDSRDKRDSLRKLLKGFNFVKLQASVFISPYALNREGVNYLKASGLMDYIRILRVDKMDDNKQLLKKFNLKI